MAEYISRVVRLLKEPKVQCFQSYAEMQEILSMTVRMLKADVLIIEGITVTSS